MVQRCRERFYCELKDWSDYFRMMEGYPGSVILRLAAFELGLARADPVLIAAVLDAAARWEDTEPPQAGKRSGQESETSRQAAGPPAR